MRSPFTVRVGPRPDKVFDKSYHLNDDARQRGAHENRNNLWTDIGHHPRSNPLEQGQAARPLTRDTPLLGLAVAFAFAGLSIATREPAGREQPSTALVTVIDSSTRYPLANADVIDLGSGQHRFTDESGRARVPWPGDGVLLLKVREVGYQPRQRTLRQSDAPGATATFQMTRVAYVISPVKATSHCSGSATADSGSLDLSVSALDQLKQGAEKYDQFRRHYPFEAKVERRTAAIPEEGDLKRIAVSIEKFKSDSWESEYTPGDIIQYYRGDFTVPLLFLSTLGDSVFWEHHCFLVSGMGSYHGSRVVRLEFSPTTDVKGPDYSGTAFLDSASSNLVRVDFRLANPPRRVGPKKLEGYITFMSPSPFVVVPDTTGAIWWMRNADHGDWGKPDYAQVLRLQELNYRKEKPPGFEKKDAPTGVVKQKE
jgi:hypothetical protein